MDQTIVVIPVFEVRDIVEKYLQQFFTNKIRIKSLELDPGSKELFTIVLEGESVNGIKEPTARLGKFSDYN